MAFHRRTVPSYFGGLPAGYDYINNAGAGVPAPVSGQAGAGPNVGTYFFQFSENITSANLNRGSDALAENCDYIDDLLRRDMAVVTKTTPAAGPASAVTVTGPGIYLGAGGDALRDIVRVVDSNHEAIVDPATGTQCVVDAIDVGGALGSGFSAGNVTFSIDPPVPAGVNYRVVYGSRSNLATAESRTLISSIGSDLDYNAKLWSLAAGGLDARYRRSFTPTLGALNTAGSGGWFHRDGPGIYGYSNVDLTGAATQSFGPGNALAAVWMADNRDFGGNEPSGGPNPFPPVTPPNNDRFGGTTSGFVFLGNQRQTYLAGETLNHNAPGFASFFHGAKRVDDGADSTSQRTYLPTGTVATISGNSITVAAPAFFREGGGSTSAIALGYDLIELLHQDGSQRCYVMVSFSSNLICQVRNLDNSIPVFAAENATIVRWIRTRFGVFDGAKEARQGFTDQYDPIYGLAGLVHITGVPGSTGGSDLNGGPAQFYSANGVPALVWGGYNDATWTFLQQGQLLDGGGVLCTSLTSTGNVTAKYYGENVQNLAAGGITKSVSFMDGGTAIWDTPAGAGVTLTVNVLTQGFASGTLIIKRGADAFTTLAVTSGAHSAVKIRTGDTVLPAASTHNIYAFKSVSTVLYVWKVGEF